MNDGLPGITPRHRFACVCAQYAIVFLCSYYSSMLMCTSPSPPSQGGISNILEELVVQPLLVSISALTLATETVRSILKIDDVVRIS